MYSSYFPPEYSGAALQAISLAKKLRDRGHYIEFVTQRWPGLLANDEIEGFPVTRLEAGRGRKHRELRLWWNLARFLRRRRSDFDILHSHGAYYTDSIIGPFGRWFGMRSLAKASLAENDLHDLKGSLTGRIHLSMLRRVDACIAISRDLQHEFDRGGVPSSRVHYLPNCVDTARFSPVTPDAKRALRVRLGLPCNKRIALYVGVFDCRKNVGWLVRHWKRTDGFGLNTMLVAIGPQSRDDPDGAFKRELLHLAAQAPDLIKICDSVSDVAEYYGAADLFVLPSQAEGLPNVVLEAMACGLPCVAADVSGSRELIRQGETGYLFAPDDVDDLRIALEKALGTGAANLGEAGRARVVRGFAIGVLAEKYERLYASLWEGDSA